MSLSTLRLRLTAGARGHQHQPLSRRREGRDGGPTGTPAAHHSLRSPPPDGHEGALVSNQASSPDVVRQPAAGRQDAAAAAVVFEASSVPSPREGADTTAAPVSIRGPSPLTALVSHEVGEQEAFLEVEPASCSSTLPAPFTTFRTIEVALAFFEYQHRHQQHDEQHNPVRAGVCNNSTISTISVRPRIRGGLLSFDSYLAAIKDHLLVTRVLPQKLWHWDQGYDHFVVELSPVGLRALRLLFELIERMHLNGMSLDGKFGLGDIMYNSEFDRLQFSSSVNFVQYRGPELFNAEFYQNDMFNIASILLEHFRWKHPTDGNEYLPVYMDQLVKYIYNMDSNCGRTRKGRSVIFNHCCMMTATERAALIQSLRDYERGLESFAWFALRTALPNEKEEWFKQMKIGYSTYQVLYYSRINQSGQRVLLKQYLPLCPLSHLDFSRCIIVHAIKSGEDSMEQAENYLAIVDPLFLPYLLERITNMYNQTQLAADALDIDNILGWRRKFDHKDADA
uniref:Uncharacterized protein n=1 Tax=Oryza rufipogon TaxID=4529 RepID=A0A0E0QU14_ORYRU